MKTSICFCLVSLSLFGCLSNKQDEMSGVKAPANQAVNDPQNSNDPSQGLQEQSFGFYSKGLLKSADTLPLEGLGFIKIFRPRNRAFATYDMIYLLSTAAKEIAELYPNRRDAIQVGDISQEQGGFISGHVSHQNGLDADIAFIRRNETMQDPNDTSGFNEKFVLAGKITENFDVERNWALAKIMTHTGRAQRIFVNPVIKKSFCQYAEKLGESNAENETLRRLRPYDGHEDHFHVRLSCPLNSPKCEAQEEIPVEAGC